LDATSDRATIAARRETFDIASMPLVFVRRPNLFNSPMACQRIRDAGTAPRRSRVDALFGIASPISATLTARRPRDSVRHIGEEKAMSKLRLTFACGPYDRTLALRDGTIQPEGIELNYIASQPPDIFWRMLQFKEFEISEMSLSNHASLVSAGEAPFVAIPVFPSRVFRHGYFFNTDKGINGRADLRGKRGGVPEYTVTAAVYMRGLLQHEYGVKPAEIEWVQGRADRLGRKLPADIRLRQAPPGSELGDLLERGEIDF